MVDFAQLRWSFLANRGVCVATLILASLQLAPKFALMLFRSSCHIPLILFISTYYNARSTAALLFFINVPKKSCISGSDIPSLATHMGRLGALHEPFPDSGALAVRIGAAWSVSDSCGS